MQPRSRPHTIAQYLRSLASGHFSLSISPRFHSRAVADLILFASFDYCFHYAYDISYFSVLYYRWGFLVFAHVTPFSFPRFSLSKNQYFPMIAWFVSLPFMILTFLIVHASLLTP